MMVLRAPRVEMCRASGACRTVIEVFGNAKTTTAGTAQHGFRISAAEGPHLGGMVGDALMAVETRYPQPAALHPQHNDVGGPLPVRAAPVNVDIDPVNRYAVDKPHIPAILGQVWGF